MTLLRLFDDDSWGTAGVFSIPFLLVVLVGCFASRAANVFGLGAAMNLCTPTDKLTNAEQLLLWWSGLRGAVAFALVLSFPSPHRRQLIATTAWIVLITVFVCGGSTPALLRRLQIGATLGGEGGGGGAEEDGLQHSRLEEDDVDAEFDQPATTSRLLQMWYRAELSFLAPHSTEAVRAAQAVARAGGASPSRASGAVSLVGGAAGGAEDLRDDDEAVTVRQPEFTQPMEVVEPELEVESAPQRPPSAGADSSAGAEEPVVPPREPRTEGEGEGGGRGGPSMGPRP